MRHGTLLRFVLMTLAITGATWFAGWWAVPVLAFVAGAMTIARPVIVALAAGLAWLLLLLVDLASPAFGRLTGTLTAVMGLPAIALVALTLLLPMILGWSAASTGHSLRTVRTRRDEVRPMK